MSKALINRSLTTVRTELEFLLDSEVITQEFYDKVTNSLPAKFQPGALAVSLGNAQAQSTERLVSHTPESSAPPPPSYNQSEGDEWVEAIFDYAAQQPEDLPLRPGDKIRVIEKPNPNWSKGECNGRVGMFPTNYTKPAADGKVDDKSRGYGGYQPGYQAPVQQYSQQPFPPASTNYYQPPVQEQPQQQAQAQQPHADGNMKKLGKKFGNAAIFGAGATVGSDIINSIF